MSTTSSTSIIVVDASLAIRAVLPVASGVNVLYLFVDWRQQGLRLVSPMLWLAECTSAIRRSVFAGVISAPEGQVALEDLFALEVEVMPMSPPQCRSALQWAERLGQARAYDGFYLAAAEELSAELWTADVRLANAARQAGVVWIHAV